MNTTFSWWSSYKGTLRFSSLKCVINKDMHKSTELFSKSFIYIWIAKCLENPILLYSLQVALKK